MKNNLHKIGVILLLVVLMLIGLHYVPSVAIGDYKARNVDILSDLRHKEKVEPAVRVDVLPVDSILVGDTTEVVEENVPVPEDIIIAYTDTCEGGVICIEDYSDSTQRGMQPFYRALDRAGSEVVRIAYFGDSFIEGDIFTADLRSFLQQNYGGCGVGFVPIHTASSGARVSVRQEAEGWENHSIMDSGHFNHAKQDIANRYFIPQAEASFALQGQKRFYSNLDRCDKASFFFRSDSAVHVMADVNGEPALDQVYDSGRLSVAEVHGDISSVTFRVMAADTSSVFYGASMDGASGISLDNFAMRGASGLNLRSVPVRTMKAFEAVRPYDLIVLQFGLNVASQEMTDYSGYVKGMRAVISHLKECFPGAGILVVSVADRDYKTEDGEILTMPGIKSLVTYQKKMAADEHVAFWNMFVAMGGDGGMRQLVESNPPMANQDYTHINSRGGRHMAKMLFDAMQYGKSKFDETASHEAY